MSGNIPRAFIDELLNRTDIVELIDAYLPLKKQGAHQIACCPFHQENTPSFKVHSKNQFYHCFGCGASGNAISFVMNFLHQGFVESIETLASRLSITVPNESGKKQTPVTPLYTLLDQVKQYYQKNLKAAPHVIAYLKQRGISGAIAGKFSLGYSSADWHVLEQKFHGHKNNLIASGMLIQKESEKCYDRFRNRLMFPIHDRKGRVVGFGGRVLNPEDTPKYLNSPESVIFQKGHELYGLYQALKNPIPFIIIVEGYMDVIALAQHGYPNAVATLGTANNAYHVQLLSKYTQKLYFCFDGDAAGQKAAWRALENSLSSLNVGLEIFFVILPPEHDPDSLIRSQGKAMFDAYIDNAKPLHKFLLDGLISSIDTGTLAGKTQLVNAAKPYLQKIPDGVYKHWFSNELARMTHLTQTLLLGTADQRPVNHQASTHMALKRTPLRIAIAIIIQHPDIYLPHVALFQPNSFTRQNQVLLKQLLSLILQQPNINTALLLEFFRDTEHFEILNKLAAWNPQVPNDALTQEWFDTMTFLLRENKEHAIQDLLDKARQQGLSEDEQQLLTLKLQEKHLNKSKA
jgi:DNA primase